MIQRGTRKLSVLAIAGLLGSLLGVAAFTASPAAAAVPNAICHYDTDTGSGEAYQAGPITAGGHTAVALDDVTATDLAGCDALLVELRAGGPHVEWNASEAAIDAAVADGLKLIVHDSVSATGPGEVPGLDLSLCSGATTLDEVDFLTGPTLLDEGPFGLLDDDALDGLSASSHGYCVSGLLPSGAVPLQSRAVATEVNSFSYPVGDGFVFYSRTPLWCGLDGTCPPDPSDTYADVYAPNLIHYVLGLDTPQTFTVDTTVDAIDADIGNGVCATAAGQCSLRAAVQEANAVPNADTIVVPKGTYALTRAGDDLTASAGDLDITEPVTIIGDDATIDASAVGDRVIDIDFGFGSADSGPAVTISGVTLTGGDTTGLTDDDGGGLFGFARLVMRDSTVTGNHASNYGGGIALSGQSVVLENVSVVANTVDDADGGAGVDIDSVEATMRNVTLTDNAGGAGSAGPVYFQPDDGLIVNTVLARNTRGVAQFDCGSTTNTTIRNTFIGANGTVDACAVTNGAGGNQVGTAASPLDPGLATSLVNGTGVATLPPDPGSPLVDNGSAADCTARDARGVERPQFVRCDIGAHEVTPPAPPTGLAAGGGVDEFVVSWDGAVAVDGSVIDYTVKLSPGVSTCTTTGLSCSVSGLTLGQAYDISVTARSAYGTSGPATLVATPAADYTALTPERILDTRSGLGTAALVGPGSSIDLQVTGAGGVPDDGVEAVILNVTSTQSNTPSFVTVWPTGSARPNASNLNTDPGQDTPNLVIAKLGTGGKVSLYNNAGQGHLIADVQGYFPSGSTLEPLNPLRLLDTRNANGVATTTPVGPLSSIDVQITGRGDIPLDGVGSVILNVTSTAATAASFATVWPTGSVRPNASNLNMAPGQDTPNLVIAKLGTGGKLSLYNNAGEGHLIADVLGWFPTTSNFTGVSPARLLDTRNGNGAPVGPLGPRTGVDVVVTGRGGVPADATAVVLNVTSTGSTVPSFATVWPTGSARPNASNLNTEPGQDTPNLVVAKVGAGGKVSLYNNAGQGHFVADVLGYFTG